ncbi:MAG TPA: RNase P subunit [Nitrososphaera sp.]|nr:RNase P subunit [Nitrososphaera sp.]
MLVQNALHERDDYLAVKQAHQAKKIAMHLRVRLPYEIRHLYCKRCKAFIVPGRTSRVRTGRAKTRAVRITCLKCNHTYRRILPWNKDL